MSLLTVRGGIPRVRRESITTAGRELKFPFFTNFLQIRTNVAVEVYFTEADWTNNENFILIPAPAVDAPYGEWQGPAEVERIWLKGSAATATVEVVAYQRRG